MIVVAFADGHEQNHKTTIVAATIVSTNTLSDKNIKTIKKMMETNFNVGFIEATKLFFL
jgi:F0F1-type ATP synthase delta subunit